MVNLFKFSYNTHEMSSTSFLSENPYVRAVSPREISVVAGDSVTLEFAVALNSDGVARNTDDVIFTFTDFNGNQPTMLSSFISFNENLPHNFVYTVEKVNGSHAGVYRASAPSTYSTIMCLAVDLPYTCCHIQDKTV